MATVSHVIAASPPRVFSVLADGWTYSNCVTGTSHMRAVDAVERMMGREALSKVGAVRYALRHPAGRG